jgi:hypothetical protein
MSSQSSDFKPGLHQWQSQDEFLEVLEEKYVELADPLNYKQVRYHKHEWDNIPPIVPKFCINLSRHVDGLSKLANRQSLTETV